MRVKISYSLVLKSGFHVGSGLGNSLINRIALKRPVIGKEDSQQFQYYVPGSTIKGRVRFACYQYLEEIGNNEDSISTLFGKEGDKKQGNHTCAFSDLNIPESSNDNAGVDDSPFTAHVRYGIQISRANGITVPHALYTTEIASPHKTETTFTGTIFLTLAKEQSEEKQKKCLGLLLTGMRLTCYLGGNKSTGQGRCSIPLDQIKITEMKKNYDPQILLENYVYSN